MPISRRSFVSSAAVLAAGTAARPGDSAMTLISDDPLGVRADFPAATSRTYLNSAYITPSPRQVLAAGQAFLERKVERPIPLGEMLRKTDEVRAQFARLINASPDEIGFLFSTSEGENIVAGALDLAPGDNVVIDELHYETEFVLYRELEARRGIQLRIVKHTNGAVHPAAFAPHIDKRTRLVSVSWVSHANGFRHDMRPIADLAHAQGALFYADAIQAIGMVPVDVQASGVDFLCCGTYKWVLGGFGVAPFYVRKDLIERIRLDRFGALHVARTLPDFRFELHKTAKRFDYSTLPFSEVYQLGAGLTYLEKVGVPRIEAHSVALARQLYEGLDRQGYKLFTPPGNASSIVTFFFTQEPGAVRAAFDAAAVDVTVRDAQKQVRVSAALFNTSDDVTRFLDTTLSISG